MDKVFIVIRYTQDAYTDDDMGSSILGVYLNEEAAKQSIIDAPLSDELGYWSLSYDIEEHDVIK